MRVGRFPAIVTAMDAQWKQRLTELMELRGTNMRAVSVKAGLGATAVRDMLKRDRMPAVDSFAAVADALECSLDWLVSGQGQSPLDTDTLIPKDIHAPPVVGEVQAGVWREPGLFEDEDIPTLPMVMDPSYRSIPQYAWRVVGNSMNRVAEHGSYVVGVRYIDLGRSPETGELAVIQRQRGPTAEYTLKRVVRRGREIALEPESTDPRFQEPIWLKSAAEAGEEVEATHLVLLVAKPVTKKVG